MREHTGGRVRQLRLVVEADDFEEAVAFYRDTLGLPVEFEVDDAVAVTEELTGGGAELIAPPTRTPWDSINSRLAAPADLQITVFEEGSD